MGLRARAMSYGLSRKIRIAFIVQALMVSLTLLLGGYLVVMVVKHTLIAAVLQEEARHYWASEAASPGLAPPDTRHIHGYLQRSGEGPDQVPAALRPLSPGFHELKLLDELVWVEQGPRGTLYMSFQRSRAERLAFWFGIIPTMLVLLAIYVVSWMTYRVSKRLVSPVSWLARRIAGWDPVAPDADDLAPERLPADVQGETRQLAVALHNMGRRVAEHVARERNFTRDASHELRTPLTVIRVAGDMALADENLSVRQQRSLLRIQRAARDMEAVIDAFLILARDADVATVCEAVDVARVVQAEAAVARPILESKGVQLHVREGGPCIVQAPPGAVQVVVANVLRNACGFTERGQIDIEVDPGVLVIRDTGIGMSPQDVQRVFEPFYRVSAQTHLAQGAGLGLSVVRRLCERFGWQVSLGSELGTGTAVTVRFS